MVIFPGFCKLLLSPGWRSVENGNFEKVTGETITIAIAIVVGKNTKDHLELMFF